MKKTCRKCGVEVGRAASVCLMCGSPVEASEPVPAGPTFKNVMDTESFVIPTGRRIVAAWVAVTAVVLASAAIVSFLTR